ncbi:alanine:cation symporter family protein, partial [Bacillus altitudinis]|uniref:alanine:cation symporter family protein n=1 Tax=Bacillus altitudinis TaxID=293387 RepID=UPI002355AAB8
MHLTHPSLTQHIRPCASPFLTIIIFLFPFTTLIPNYYYPQTNIQFFPPNKISLNIYPLALIPILLFPPV